MYWLTFATDVILHLDRYLNDRAVILGPWLYVALFLSIFLETGLVVTLFLPADSLLFAVGAMSAREGSPIRLEQVTLLLWAAAVLGYTANYAAGTWAGPKVFSREDTGLLNKKHLVRAIRFYDKYGGKTIILARFVPVVRTFAPFVAGIGRMSYPRFALYNVVGGGLWIFSLLLAGHLFGERAGAQQHFHYFIWVVIVLSVLLTAFEYLKEHRKAGGDPPLN